MKIHRYIKEKYPNFYIKAIVRVLAPLVTLVAGGSIMLSATISTVFLGGAVLGGLSLTWMALCFFDDIDENVYKIWEDYAKWERKS